MLLTTLSNNYYIFFYLKSMKSNFYYASIFDVFMLIMTKTALKIRRQISCFTVFYLKNRCWDRAFISSYKKYFSKLKENFGDHDVFNKNLFFFFEIPLLLPRNCLWKTCVKPENFDLWKYGFKESLVSPNW